MESVTADPTTVLSTITTGMGALQVSSVPTSSEPTTPSSESPLSLDASLREWLTEALVANSTNPKVYTKLLVSNAAAGSVIGKAGGNINDLQAKTYARIQLSKANEYFPGTTERTLLVTGRLKQVVAALGLIFAKLLREGVAPLSPRSKAFAAFPRPGAVEAGEAPPPLRLLVRLLVPQPLCGVIIGKNGVTIRNYAADTGTVIRVTSGETSQMSTSHRIVTIAGETEGVLKAIALMVLKQSDDPKFPLYSELPSPTLPGGMPRLDSGGGISLAMPHPYHQPQYLPASMAPLTGGPGGAGMPFGMPATISSAPAGSEGFTSLGLMLTEDQASILLDQNSRAVLEVEQMTGCRARLDMSDGPRGPFGRLLLAGSPEAVAYGQWLLGQRLAAAAASFNVGGTTYYSYNAAPTGFAGPPPSMGFMATPFAMMPPPPAQQQMLAAAVAGMMPPQHLQQLPLRQHSGSSNSTPGA